jgi:hypothetical protein
VRPVPPIRDHPKADEILPDTPLERPFLSGFDEWFPPRYWQRSNPGGRHRREILSWANSRATIFAKATYAALLDEYAIAPVLLKMRVPLTETVITIAPPCFRSRGTLARVVRNVLVKLVVDV